VDLGSGRGAAGCSMTQPRADARWCGVLWRDRVAGFVGGVDRAFFVRGGRYCPGCDRGDELLVEELVDDFTGVGVSLPGRCCRLRSKRDQRRHRGDAAARWG
jgi:hypothetical protein